MTTTVYGVFVFLLDLLVYGATCSHLDHSLFPQMHLPTMTQSKPTLIILPSPFKYINLNRILVDETMSHAEIPIVACRFDGASFARPNTSTAFIVCMRGDSGHVMSAAGRVPGCCGPPVVAAWWSCRRCCCINYSSCCIRPTDSRSTYTPNGLC